MCLEVCRLLALALDAVAESGMRHGDIIGANVLVREGTPVLIDPDSARRNSGARSDASEFSSFVAIVADSKIAVNFPAVLVALEKLNPEARPFRAAAEILRHERPEVLLQSPSDRLELLGATYRRKTADRSSRFNSLVENRRNIFNQLTERAAKDCKMVGIGLDSWDLAESEQLKAKELECLSSPGAGATLQPSLCRFVATGFTWKLELLSHSDFVLPSPFSLSSQVGRADSVVSSHRGEILLQDSLRFLYVSGSKSSTIEVQAAPNWWLPLPEDWAVRIMEVLIGERVPAFPSVQELSGERDDPEKINNLEELIQERLLVQTSTLLAELCRAVDAHPKP